MGLIDGSLELGRGWRDRFIYIGDQETLLQAFESELMKQVRFKLGLVPSTNNPLAYQQQYITEGSTLPTNLIPKFQINSLLLNGKHFRISGTHIPPYVSLNEDGSAGGSHDIMIQCAASAFNFTTDWDVVNGRGIGFKSANGTPSGVMADVYYGRADIAGNTALTLDRLEFMDFTDPFFQDSLVFVTSRHKSELNWNSIISSYDLNIWLLILLTFILCMGIYYALFPREVPKTERALQSCFIPYALILGQDVAGPKRVRSISLLWIFFGMFITAGYNCNLTSFLSVPSGEAIPTTFPQLTARLDYKINFHYIGGSAYAFLKNSKSKTYVTLFNRLDALFRDPINCTIRAILEPRVSCIGWNLLLANTIASNLTLSLGYDPLYVSKTSPFSVSIALGFPQKSVHTSDFNRIGSMYKDTGLISKWNYDTINSYKLKGFRWLTETKGKMYRLLKGDMEDEEVDYFQLPNLLIIFFFHFSVCFMGLILLAAEILVARQKRLNVS
jgi:hypothetical protein